MLVPNGEDVSSVSGPVRQRSTRDRPAKPPLSEDAVIDAALVVLKTGGIEAVTMRRVAQALDTGAASLYVYVGGRESLLEAMLDRVVATVPLEPPDRSRWRDQLHTLLARLYSALVAHPGIASITLAASPAGEAVLGLSENLLGILLAGGLAPRNAAWACDVLIALSTAAAREHEVRSPGAGDKRVPRDQPAKALGERFAALPADRFPLLRQYAAEMVAGEAEERFRFAIDAVIDGLLGRAASD